MKNKYGLVLSEFLILFFILSSCSHLDKEPSRKFASVSNLEVDSSINKQLIGLFQELVPDTKPARFRFKVCSLIESPRITVNITDYFSNECKVHYMYIGKTQGYSLLDLERIDGNINKNIKKVVKEGLVNGLVIMAGAAGVGAMYGSLSIPGPMSLIGAGGGLIVGAGTGLYLTFQDYKDAKASTSSFKEFAKEVVEKLYVSKISNSSMEDIKILEKIITNYDY